jgi:DedD protein
MDQNDTASTDDDTLRKRLLSRIAVAGVAILGLLGGLAVHDALNKSPAPALPKMAAAPTEPAEPIAPVVKAEEEKLAEENVVEEKTEAEAVPERTETALAPLRLAKPLTPPASARPTGIKPPPPVVAPVKPETARAIARVMPEHATPAHAPASRPLAQVAEGARRLLVQVGVFGNHANAEELVARLRQAGIPAHIESHVQIGPFASRAEADAARTKLQALGIDDGLLVRR